MINNDKVTLLVINEILSKNFGVTKKMSEGLAKAFFDTIAEALNADGFVQINGLGTFRVVDVSERESVNVQNGERIMIAGYKKVSFTPDEDVVKRMNPSKDNNATKNNGTTDVNDTTEDNDTTQVGATPKEPVIDLGIDADSITWAPSDMSENIDSIISTPESIAEVRSRYEESLAEVNRAMDVARQAMAKKIRLEKMLADMESKAEIPLFDAKENSEEQEGSVTAVVNPTNDSVDSELQVIPPINNEQASEQSDEPEPHDEVLDRYLKDEGDHYEMDNEDKAEEKAKKRGFVKGLIWSLVVGIVLAICVIVGYKFIADGANTEVAKETEVETLAKADMTPQVVTDSIADTLRTVKSDSVKTPQDIDSTVLAKKDEDKPAKPVTPKVRTHVMAKGDNLYRISRKYYGTNDSVAAIIRYNGFSSPDKITIGTTIKLP